MRLPGVGAGPVPARCPCKGHMHLPLSPATFALTGNRAGMGPAPTLAGFNRTGRKIPVGLNNSKGEKDDGRLFRSVLKYPYLCLNPETTPLDTAIEMLYFVDSQDIYTLGGKKIHPSHRMNGIYIQGGRKVTKR